MSQETGRRCYYCHVPLTDTPGETLQTIDHVWPISRPLAYPKHLKRPLRYFACYRCNQIKDNMLPLEWFHFLMGLPSSEAIRQFRGRGKIYNRTRRIAERQAKACAADRYASQEAA